MNPGFARAASVAAYYRKIGLCPLPSRMDRKGPDLETFAQHYGPEPVPESVYENWATTNIQIITGTKSPTPTKIIVVDCDGEEAKEKWIQIKAHHGYQETSPWITETGAGGTHTYFTLPGCSTCVSSGLIWGLYDPWGDGGKGKWCRHKEIRILADNALVIAPPSQHVETGDHYRFLTSFGPKVHCLPESAPQWLIDLPRLSRPNLSRPLEVKWKTREPVRTSGNSYDRDDVLDAIGSGKLEIARGWGLTTRGDRPNPNGWVQCYVPGREDPRRSRSASGSFSFLAGTLYDHAVSESMTFFDIGVALGRFDSWHECKNYLGDQYLRGK